MTRRRAARRGAAGFVLAELLVAMFIAAIIGASLTQLVISQSRFVALQGALMQARGGARAALNVMAGDLGMVSDSGASRRVFLRANSGTARSAPSRSSSSQARGGRRLNPGSRRYAEG